MAKEKASICLCSISTRRILRFNGTCGRLGQRLLKGEELIGDAVALVDRAPHNVDHAVAREAALAVELVLDVGHLGGDGEFEFVVHVTLGLRDLLREKRA